jgi:hypothetical protein
LPADPEWLAELERRARRALADPSGREAWEVVERRLDARFYEPMTKSIRIDAEADDEISHAIGRYEREREGLGAEFLG